MTFSNDRRSFLIRKKTQRGSTPIELLVVIAVLVPLLLPAVRQAREAVQSIPCENDLTEIRELAEETHFNIEKN